MLARPRPNLFIIGAMKSGSTSLHYYLSKHPDIFMCEPKEPWYFIKEINWKKGENWYLSLFENAGNAIVIGESSTDYTKIPRFMGVPELINKFNPNSRFIYVMRDPVLRSISHYWHNVQWSGEKRDMFTAMREDQHIHDVSNYIMQLSPYFDIFGKEKIYTLTFEEMIQQPQATLYKIFGWLGVNENFIPQNIAKKENVTPGIVEQIKGIGVLHKFRYSPCWNRIHGLVPDGFIKFAKKFAVAEVKRDTQDIEQVVTYLRELYLNQTELLSIALGRHFSEWTTLYGPSDFFVDKM